MNRKNLSPLRYPGGKNNLYSFVKSIIVNNNLQKKVYVEPFAGGFGLGLKLMLNGDMSEFIINDYDWHIYAFWKCLFFHTKSLIKRIKETEITIEEWKKQKYIYSNYKKYSIIDVGFSTLFLNRTNYSGIMKSGPIGGYNQTGKYKLNCRFNKKYIIELIEEISKYKHFVKIYNMDAIKLIHKLKQFETNIMYNFDPPYVKKGKDLYLNSYNLDDHIKLHNVVINVKSNWIMTYDNHEFIKKLYNDCFFCEQTLRYSVGSKRKDKELLISNFYRCA